MACQTPEAQKAEKASAGTGGAAQVSECSVGCRASGLGFGGLGSRVYKP